MNVVKFKKLLETAKTPTRATAGSAAFDLYSAEEILIPRLSENLSLPGITVDHEKDHDVLWLKKEPHDTIETKLYPELYSEDKSLEDYVGEETEYKVLDDQVFEYDYCYNDKDVPRLEVETEIVKVHTGIAVEIPAGYVGLIFARSGLATKEKLSLANSVGVIDSDYRGEVMVALINHSKEEKLIAAGDRIAQLMIVPIYSFELEEVEELSSTDRGSGGFGSTGRS